MYVVELVEDIRNGGYFECVVNDPADFKPKGRYPIMINPTDSELEAVLGCYVITLLGSDGRKCTPKVVEAVNDIDWLMQVLDAARGKTLGDGAIDHMIGELKSIKEVIK